MTNKLKIVPLRYNVLIEVDTVDEMANKFVKKPDSVIEKEQYRMNRGTLVSVGEMAFKDWTDVAPQVGERVLFDMYKGVMMPYTEKVEDKTETTWFRVLLDTEVLGRIMEE
jgi:co-chaperonin GroES (HSP10)